MTGERSEGASRLRVFLPCITQPVLHAGNPAAAKCTVDDNKANRDCNRPGKARHGPDAKVFRWQLLIAFLAACDCLRGDDSRDRFPDAQRTPTAIRARSRWPTTRSAVKVAAMWLSAGSADDCPHTLGIARTMAVPRGVPRGVPTGNSRTGEAKVARKLIRAGYRVMAGNPRSRARP